MQKGEGGGGKKFGKNRKGFKGPPSKVSHGAKKIIFWARFEKAQTG